MPLDNTSYVPKREGPNNSPGDRTLLKYELFTKVGQFSSQLLNKYFQFFGDIEFKRTSKCPYIRIPKYVYIKRTGLSQNKSSNS